MKLLHENFSHWFLRWRIGGELEWFLVPTLAFTHFEDGSWHVTLHFLKVEAGYYRDCGGPDESY